MTSHKAHCFIYDVTKLPLLYLQHHRFVLILVHFNMNFTKIWDLPSSETEAIEFLQERNVLPSMKFCPLGHEMKLYITASRAPFWSCRRQICRGLASYSLRSGSWLENSRLSFLNVVRFIYFWSEEMTSIAFCEKQLNMNKNSLRLKQLHA
jgi:hypothetical protein